MTSTEIAVRQPASVAVTERDVVDGWITVVADVAKLSDHIAETDFVPRALRNKPAAIAACILTGRELGIGPMASLKSIHMVQGVPSLSAEYKRARALAAGHQIVVDESNATRCVVRGRRSGSEAWVSIQWTLDMAKRAKLSGKDVWQAYPQRMLQARATSELCDLLFPDATLGLPTTEELEDGGVLVAAEVAVQAAAETGAEPEKPAGPRTARRRQVPADRPTGAQAAAASAEDTGRPAPAPAQTAPSATRTPVPSSDLPPLPGEDEPTESVAPATETDRSDRHRRLTGIVHQHFKRLGFGDDEREQRLATTAVLAGIAADLDSSSDLTEEQLSTVADTLARCKDRDRLIALLAAGESDA